ncbi:hypothetical protein B0E53_06447 [Micromonospora sp. MH33]|nr:hypothetical protein B0E53_06447 [Micromonospora sp. MH33]
MSASYYVYVGVDSLANYEKGKAQGIWGWESSVLDRGGADGSANRTVALRIRPDDYLILGFSTPGGPRVNDQQFFAQDLAEVLITRVTRPLYQSVAKVWDDKPYPERVDVEVLQTLERVPGWRLGPAAMRALRLSGTKQGTPVVGEPVAITALEEGTDGDQDELDLTGDLDALVSAIRRREQRRLRRLKFGSLTEVMCDLCGRTLPARLVSAARIKRRADATRRERLNPDNIMAACLFGCDALFEHGHVVLDATGTIRLNPDLQGELLAAARHLAGRRCGAYSPRSRPFFEAHARRFSQERLDQRWQADWDVATDVAAMKRHSEPERPTLHGLVQGTNDPHR